MRAQVVRLGAECDLVPEHEATASPGSISFTVSEFAVLSDGRRVTLHAGERGWSVSGVQGRDRHPLGVLTAADVFADALTTVLPDEDDGEQHPWEWLAELLRRQGVAVSADALRGVPYEVVLSPRLQRLLASPR